MSKDQLVVTVIYAGKELFGNKIDSSLIDKLILHCEK